jgi:hypothetical protein
MLNYSTIEPAAEENCIPKTVSTDVSWAKSFQIIIIRCAVEILPAVVRALFLQKSRCFL